MYTFSFTLLLALTFSAPYQSVQYSYNNNSDVNCTAFSPSYYGQTSTTDVACIGLVSTQMNFTLSYDREGVTTYYFKSLNVYCDEYSYDVVQDTYENEPNSYTYEFRRNQPLNNNQALTDFLANSYVYIVRYEDDIIFNFHIYEGNGNFYNDTKTYTTSLWFDSEIEYYMYFDLNILDFENYVTSHTYDSSAYYDGYDEGYSDGYNFGYSEGVTDTMATGSTAQVIFTGIIDVALIPINFFLACLNFEVFGINIGGFVSALLTIAIVVILIRSFMGGKGGDSND